METADIFEIGAVVVGLILLAIGVIDYFRNKKRKFGENPKDATWS